MKCNKCGREAAVYLAYGPMNLCKRHFLEMFEKRAMRTNREFRLIGKGERVALGLSGGKDSTVMMHVLAKLAESMPFEMVAITIDEGIRGYRDRTLEIAKNECKRLGIEHKIVDMKKELGFSMDDVAKKLAKRKSSEHCSYCGVFRRYLLNRKAREIGADKLAIGHNLDDAVQTLLMNLMRNEPLRLGRFGVDGGIVEEGAFVRRIKPLIRSPERENALYALLEGIEIDYRECPYAQGALRQHVRNQLNGTEEKYPGTKMRMFSSFLEMQKLAADAAKKELANGKRIGTCSICKEPSADSGEVCMCCKMLERLGKK